MGLEGKVERRDAEVLRPQVTQSLQLLLQSHTDLEPFDARKPTCLLFYKTNRIEPRPYSIIPCNIIQA
jgi:hypothetical protein